LLLSVELKRLDVVVPADNAPEYRPAALQFVAAVLAAALLAAVCDNRLLRFGV
jgi:hypothetical protein